MNVLIWCKKEFIKMLPTIVFFLIAFSLVNATDRAVNKHALTYYSFFSCVIASLIMGKVVLIADSLRIIGLFSHKPLIYATIWKSFLYVVCSIILRLVEHAAPAIYEGATWPMISHEIMEHITKPLFWIAQAWLGYLFIIFVSYRELIFAIGKDKVLALFFKGEQK